MQDRPERKTQHLQGRTLAWREQGTGVPLVLIHGIGGTSESWDPLWSRLSRTYRVVAWDMPGYGGSEPLPEDRPTADDYAAMLEALLSHLGIEQAHVLGHSLGAVLTAALCRRNPALARSVTLVHGITGTGSLEPEKARTIREQRLKEYEQLGPRGFAEQRGRGILGPKVAGPVADRVVEVMAEIPAPAYVQAWEMLCQADIFPDLPHVRVPALVLGGSVDPVSPPEMCRAVADALPDARRIILEDVGHFAMLEVPERFLETLERFLGEAALAQG